MPAVKWEWKVNILEVGLLLSTMLAGGVIFYTQVIQNTEALAKGDARMVAQTIIVQSVKERTSVLETKLDFLIDQNKEVISLLKR